MTGRLSNRNAYSYRTTDYQDKPARSSRIQYDTDNRGSPRRQICYNRRTRQSYRVLSRKGTESLSRPHRAFVTVAIRRLHPARFNRLLILQGMKHGLYAFHSLYFLFIRSIDSPPIPIFVRLFFDGDHKKLRRDMGYLRSRSGEPPDQQLFLFGSQCSAFDGYVGHYNKIGFNSSVTNIVGVNSTI